MQHIVIGSCEISCRSGGIGASGSPHPTCCASINLCRFRGRMIFAHIANFFTIHFYLLLFTLSEAKQTPQSRLCRAGSPTGGAEKQANEVRPYGRNNKICEDFVPLTRQRCVESPHPTSCVSINLYRFCGRMISAPTIYRINLCGDFIPPSPHHTRCILKVHTNNSRAP